MAVDISKIREGDEVTVRLTVRENDGGSEYPIQVKHEADCESAEGVWVDAANIVSHTPREIQVGDGVLDMVTAKHGTVLAARSADAWVEMEDNSTIVRKLSDLERIP